MVRGHRCFSRVSSTVIILVLVIGVWGLSVSVVHGASRAPDFTLTDIDGNTFSLSDFQGQVVLLEFLQTWCSRCVAEIPHDKAVQDEYGDNIVILYISVWHGDTDDVLRRFRDEHEIPWIVARGSANLHEVYEITSTPTTYIIDPEGYVRYHHVSLIDASVLIEEIRDLVPVTLTITTSPRLEGVNFRIDDDNYYSMGGNISVALERGHHQVELVDLVIHSDEGLEYRFNNWSEFATGTENPLSLHVTAPSTIETHFTVHDIAPPVTNAGHDLIVYEGTVVTFNGSASTDNVAIANYVWTFLDEGLHEAIGVTYHYTFTRPGVYAVTLNVTDVANNWTTDTILVTVLDLTQPLANAGGDQIVPEDTPVVFDGSASTDNVEVTHYTWTFTDTLPQRLEGVTPAYTFTTPGTYIVTLTVLDAAGNSATDTLTLTVEDVTPPIADAGRDQIVEVGMSVTVSAEHTMDNGEIASYTWAFGDGVEDTGVTSHHTYLEPGNYSVTLTVRDEAANVDTDVVTIIVLPSDVPQVFTVNSGDQTVPVVVRSSYSIAEGTFRAADGSLQFRVEDVSPTLKGFCNVTLPRTLFGDAYTVNVDDTQVLPLETRNDTHAFLYFKFPPGIHTISVMGVPSGLVNLSGLALIFTAGALALLSPCGFPLLPGYVSYYLGHHTSTERAVSGGVVCTLGLMAVFTVIGFLASSLAAFLSQYILVLELGAGVLAVILGIGMLMKMKLPLPFSMSRAPRQKGLGGIFLYGVTYGLAILGCSAPLFFSTLFYAIASGGLLQCVITFLVYALGMGLPLILTTLLVAKARKLLIKKALHAMPWFHKMSSIILILIGVYLITYYHFHANGL